MKQKKYITAISHIKCLHVYFSFSFFSFTFLIFSQTRFAESWMTVTWKWCIVCYIIHKTDGVREYSGIIDWYTCNSKQLLLTTDMSSFNSVTSAFFSFNDFFSASSSVSSSCNEPLPPLSELLPGSFKKSDIQWDCMANKHGTYQINVNKQQTNLHLQW